MQSSVRRYMADEPDTVRAWIPPDTLRLVRQAVRGAEDSQPGCSGHHPVSVAYATLQAPGNNNASHYNGTADVYMFDDYPCRCSPGWHPRPGNAFAGDDFERVSRPGRRAAPRRACHSLVCPAGGRAGPQAAVQLQAAAVAAGVYVCMCVCVHVCMCACVYVCMCVW